MRNSNRLGIVLGIGLIAAAVWMARSKRRRQHEMSERDQTKERLSAWDNEGGNIPNVQTVRPHPEDLTSLH